MLRGSFQPQARAPGVVSARWSPTTRSGSAHPLDELGLERLPGSLGERVDPPVRVLAERHRVLVGVEPGADEQPFVRTIPATTRVPDPPVAPMTLGPGRAVATASGSVRTSVRKG